MSFFDPSGVWSITGIADIRLVGASRVEAVIGGGDCEKRDSLFAKIASFLSIIELAFTVEFVPSDRSSSTFFLLEFAVDGTISMVGKAFPEGVCNSIIR
jgi:hypothetical protein